MREGETHGRNVPARQHPAALRVAHPRIPSDFNVIEHVSDALPDPANRFYTTFSAEEAEKAVRFNRTGLDKNVPVI
jgi:hypothetical protein